MATTTKTAATPRMGTALSSEEMHEIATDALIYAYPLVLMEMTRRALTNVEEPTTTSAAPMNQFSHLAAFPDPSMTTVVRPNADTLYSTMWFDVSKEPLLIDIPDSGGRYYLLQLLDMWTDVFDSIGARTTGTAGQRLVLVGPKWAGAAPTGTTVVRSPTSIGWIIGRTQTNGAADYPRVHEFQRAISVVPLAEMGKPYTPPQRPPNPAWETQLPPVEQIDHMSAEVLLSIFVHASRGNPPHANDNAVLHRMRRIGLEPGKAFSFGEISVELRRAIDEAWPAALERIKNAFLRAGTPMNGWRVSLSGVGSYGTDYLQRAGVAYAALAANSPDDAVYPTVSADSDGRPLSSDERYAIHFEHGQLPPVRAFWSLTVYDARQLFAANPINRYALGDRDPLISNADGSVDLYIQRSSPGPDKEANWLPAPASGAFSMNMRLYWPSVAVTDGAWSPPPVKRVI